MNEQTTAKLCAWLRYLFLPEKVRQGELDTSDTALDAVFSLAKTYDVAGMVAEALLSMPHLSLSPERLSAYQNEVFVSLARYEQMAHMQKEVYTQFETAHIPFLPLKGAVLRKYYPEAWMRTSCDIDILISKEHFEKADNLLCGALGYERASVLTAHDVSYYAPGGVHLELHHSLMEADVLSEAEKPLQNVWDYTYPKAEGGYEMLMRDEMFYYYHISHIAKHFVHGGCGLRPLLDLWLLESHTQTDTPSHKALLTEGGLLTFDVVLRELVAVWFKNTPHTDQTKKLEAYIEQGGLYGSVKNRVVMGQGQTGSKGKYLLRRIWQPYDTLSKRYPSLRGRRWLTWFFQLRRWLSACSPKRIKTYRAELKYTSQLSEMERDAAEAFLQQLGLRDE